MNEDKEKLLKIKSEIALAEQNLINALNHLRDFEISKKRGETE
jgi:hypothetical protein